MVRWGRWWQQSTTQKKDKHIGLVHGVDEKPFDSVDIRICFSNSSVYHLRLSGAGPQIRFSSHPHPEVVSNQLYKLEPLSGSVKWSRPKENYTFRGRRLASLLTWGTENRRGVHPSFTLASRANALACTMCSVSVSTSRKQMNHWLYLNLEIKSSYV